MIKTHISWASFEVNEKEEGKSNEYRFEALCRQLFVNEFVEKESRQRFLQAVVNNPGIETEPIYDEKKKVWIGFQSKYFSKNISYDVIKDSCQKAVKFYKNKLGELVLFCNRQPSPQSTTFKESEDFLESNGIKLTIIAGEAIFDLVRKYDKLREYYFGQILISDEWLREHDERMVKLLGSRFEAGLNVNTESERLLSLFTLDDKALKYINQKKKELLSKIDSIYWSDSLHEKYLNMIYRTTENLPDVHAGNIPDAFEWYESVREKVKEEVAAIEKEIDVLEKKNQDLSDKHKDDISDRSWYQEYDRTCDKIQKNEELVQLLDLLQFSNQEKNLITGKILAIAGVAGTGKSHLFAHETNILLEEGRTPLFLIAGMYSSNSSIQNQIMDNCGLDFTFNELIDILDMKGAEQGRPIMLFIDALNETTNRSLWEAQLSTIISQIEKSSFVRFAFSFRPEYRDEIFSEDVRNSIDNGEICHFKHSGFKNISIQAARDFFKYYGIPFGLYEFFQTNMDNPLFLKLYCKTYKGGEVSLPILYERLICMASENIYKNMSSYFRTLGYSKSYNLLLPLIKELSRWFSIHSKRIISLKEILTLDYWKTYTVTPLPFLNKIIEEGVLLTFPSNKGCEIEDYYSFTFDQMNDYFIAKAIVSSSQSEEEVRDNILKNVLITSNRDSKIILCDLFINICVLYADKYSKECIDLLDGIDAINKDYTINQYFLSFKWRKEESIRRDEFIHLLKKYCISDRTVCEVLIHNSVKSKHPLNSEFLHSILFPKPLSERDYVWTSLINQIEEINPRVIDLIELYNSGDRLEEIGSDQLTLLLILIGWLLTSTNRELRDRASKAMIEILKVDLNLCLPILRKFEDVNDPYVLQRLHGVVFGACSKRIGTREKEFLELAEYIYMAIFSKDEVYPDILLRDYARLTIELFLKDNPEYSGLIDKTRIAPPYRSTPIPRIDEDFTEDRFSSEHYGSSRIKSSMRVENLGMYGDFGRYVFERALREFEVDILNLYNYSIIFIRDELGYTDLLFSDIDRNINQVLSIRSSRLSKRIERIGKKYQWIAFYNILARVADNCPMLRGFSDYDGDKPRYEGPWNPYVRDFDPTLNEHFLKDADAPQFDKLEEYFKQSKADSFNKEHSDQDWLETTGFFLEKLEENLIQKDKNGTSWVMLDGYFDPCQGRRIQHEHMQWSLLHAFFISKKSFSFFTENENWKRYFPWNILRQSENYTFFNREYPWFSSCNEIRERELESQIFKVETANGKKIQIELNDFLHATNKFSWEEEYDYSKKERVDWRMGCSKLIEVLDLHRGECDCAFYDNENRLATFDLRFTQPYEALVLRQDLLDEFLKKTQMMLVWFIQAEKYIQNEETHIYEEYKKKIGFYHYDHRKKILGEICSFENEIY